VGDGKSRDLCKQRTHLEAEQEQPDDEQHMVHAFRPAAFADAPSGIDNVPEPQSDESPQRSRGHLLADRLELRFGWGRLCYLIRISRRKIHSGQLSCYFGNLRFGLALAFGNRRADRVGPAAFPREKCLAATDRFSGGVASSQDDTGWRIRIDLQRKVLSIQSGGNFHQAERHVVEFPIFAQSRGDLASPIRVVLRTSQRVGDRLAELSRAFPQNRSEVLFCLQLFELRQPFLV